MNRKKWKSYEEARKFARTLNLKNYEEWREYTKAGNKPHDIPTMPERSYKNEWTSYGDFLGTGRNPRNRSQRRSFEEARKFARTLNLKNYEEWREYCKAGNKPQDIPAMPERTYKNEWTTYGDFLGTGNIQNRKKEFLSFNESKKKYKKIVKEHGIKSQSDWKKYVGKNKLPEGLPSNPGQFYSKSRVEKRRRNETKIQKF